MPLFANRLICTHIHDNSGVFNSDDHWLPFSGNVDYERVARQIKESGFQGTLMLEVFAKPKFYGDWTTDAYFERAAEAAKRLRTMVDGE